VWQVVPSSKRTEKRRAPAGESIKSFVAAAAERKSNKIPPPAPLRPHNREKTSNRREQVHEASAQRAVLILPIARNCIKMRSRAAADAALEIRRISHS